MKADETGQYNEALVAFLYLLLRDELPFGKVEGILSDLEKPGAWTRLSVDSRKKRPYRFTEKTIERYARLLAARIGKLP